MPCLILCRSTYQNMANIDRLSSLQFRLLLVRITFTLPLPLPRLTTRTLVGLLVVGLLLGSHLRLYDK